MTLLVPSLVLTGSWSWARQALQALFCLNALVMLGVSCRLAMFLIGKRILSIVMDLSLISRTAPISCKVCLPMIRSYIGALAPVSYSTLSGVRWTDLLAEYSTKEMLLAPTFLVWKVPLEVPHDCGTFLFTHGMYLWEPFLMKRRLPLDPVLSSTIIVVLTIFPLLSSLLGLTKPYRCDLDWFGCFFFIGLVSIFPELEFRELTMLLPKIFITATTAVTFPVSEVSVAFCLALITFRAVLVALIGRVSVEFNSMPVGLSSLKRSSTWSLGLLYPLS
jgi:hypothetical protein